MAMTKAEKAALEAAQRGERVAYAFGWPKEAEPKQVSIKEFCEANPGMLFQGYTFNTYMVLGGSMSDVRHAVRHGCASTGGHACTELYNPMPTRTSTQGAGGPWYRTEREAWIACRWAVCRKMANLLADLDEKIYAGI
jgi:hypothetical protein